MCSNTNSGIQNAIKKSSIIFQGRVEKTLYVTPFVFLTKFNVEHYWKNNQQITTVIYVIGSACIESCSFSFLEGHHYIVFGEIENGFYRATTCMPSQELYSSDATQNIINVLNSTLGDPKPSRNAKVILK
ncbi:MAG: hypothetical protein P857_1034 [Candidatus Xenolissoclinum pacificiensis L6]|uniref:Uncharacterized protein n=1 Tax=Candidatus Xenolissoclinum pacificiensis L6 TaxID=1401685 RepID=W2V0C0_9RICK|nr:MAG: hypothetical protein P857_1034 [Candidatus Xenolissoclinum pacificiensis L6]